MDTVESPWATDCEIINMVKTLNGAIATVSQDTACIQRILRAENMARDKALANLSAMVKEYGSSPVTMRPHPVIQADVLDEEGNLRATDNSLIVCTDFSSLSTPAHLHRPVEQTFAVHQQMETPYAEEDCDSEAVFAVGDHPPWAKNRQIRPVSPRCNRCSHWLAG